MNAGASATWGQKALAAAEPAVLWLDNPTRPEPRNTMGGGRTADLVIVGGGFTGLWAAIQAKEDDPSRSVIVVELGRISEQASGRNGGFCSSSLTHGLENGESRFAKEMSQIESLAGENFVGIHESIERYGIDCGWETNGTLDIATAEWQVEGICDQVALGKKYGHDIEFLNADQLATYVTSPTYLAGALQRDNEALVDPARLGWGLADAAESLGVQIFERTPMLSLDRSGSGMAVRTESGTIRCGAVLLGTNAFRSPVSAINRTVAPVYDYVLATEPLSVKQMDSIGWSGRQGISDAANQFHYYRLTADNRILWGGYDAVYYFGNKIDSTLDQRDETHEMLAQQFFETFPQLEGLKFSHRWGGVIDTCTRFSASFGTEFDGRVSYAVGYTGLGVGASRFGARVGLDLLYSPDSKLLDLEMVRKRPLPFPPEPIRWLGIELTRRAIAKADRNEGKRGPWLRALDAVGLGFDS